MTYEKTISNSQYLVHSFKTKDFYYIYDTNTNHILSVDKEIYNFFLEEKRKSSSCTSKISKSILNANNLYKVFSHNKPQINSSTYPFSFLKNKIEHQLKQIILKITDNCNCRCKYCIYSGIYQGRPKYGLHNMSKKTAKESIEYLFKHSEEQKKTITLTFFGGEPFLNFKVMEYATNYFRENLDNHEGRVTVSTNGTILSKKIIDFLVKNNIILTVSIDGPQKIHDKNRVDINNQGTFSLIKQNLQLLNEISPEYVKTYIRINCTLAPPIDYRKLDIFFASFPAVGIQTSLVEIYGSIFFNNIKKKGLKTKNYNSIRQKFIDGILTKKISKIPLDPKYKFVYSSFFRNIQKIHNRKIFSHLTKNHYAGGLCFPGSDNLLVDYNGDFYVCEKVDGNTNMNIGNLKTGINLYYLYKKINEFYAFLGEACVNCWLNRLCPVCFAHSVYNGEFNRNKIDFSCSLYRSYYDEILSLYCEIMEKDPDSLDFSNT